MTTTTPTRSRSSSEQRVGAAVAVVANAVVLYLIHVWPGWEVVPFLTGDTPAVLGWVTAAVLAGMAANLATALSDRDWVKPLGEAVSSVVGLGALVQIWQVFPFAFADPSPWPTVFRVVLGFALVGTAIAVVVNIVTFTRRAR